MKGGEKSIKEELNAGLELKLQKFDHDHMISLAVLKNTEYENWFWW